MLGHGARSAARVVLRVDLREPLPLVGQLVLGEARVDRAGLDAGVAVDALLGVDEELIDLVVVGLVRRRVDAVDGADLDTGVVLHSDAGLGDHVGHGGKAVPRGLGTGERLGAAGRETTGHACCGTAIRCARAMLLLTGATGLVGSALLPRLVAGGTPVRCLVRDPRRLGAERVRVQIALGDLTDPPSFRNAMRGVTTVVHLAAAIRDQPAGSIEELNGIATWRMVEAAERAGVERFVFFSALGATAHDRTRFLRAKALAEDAVASAGHRRRRSSRCSIVYAPGDAWLTLVERLSLLPRRRHVRQRARAVPADLGAGRGGLRRRGAGARAGGARTSGSSSPGRRRCSHEAIVRLVAAGRRARAARCVQGARARSCAARCGSVRRCSATRAPATWDEAELLEVSLDDARGVADARGARCRAAGDGGRAGRGTPAALRRVRGSRGAWRAVASGVRAYVLAPIRRHAMHPRSLAQACRLHRSSGVSRGARCA